MFESLAQALAAGLTLWSDKEKTKYVDRLVSIRKRYYEEYNKPLSSRDDSVLDQLEFELRILAASFASGIGKSNSTP